MADSFDPLLIKIQSIADLKAVQQARNEMQLLQNQVPGGTELWKQLDTSIKGMDDSLSAVANKTLPETSDGADSAEKQLHKMHMAMRLVGGQFGEMGHLAHGFIMGLGGLVAGAILLHETSKAVEELKNTIESLDTKTGALGDWGEKIKESFCNAQIAAAEYQASLTNILNTQNTIRQNTDEMIRQDKARQQAEKSLSDAQKDLELESIKLRAARGVISPSQAAKETAEVQEKYLKQEADAKSRAMEEERVRQRWAQEMAKQKQPELQSAAQGTDTAVTQAHAAVIKNQAEIEQDLANMTATREQADKLRKEVEAWRAEGITTTLLKTFKSFGVGEAVRAWGMLKEEAEVKRMDELVANYQESLRRGRVKVVPLGETEAEAKSADEEAKKKLTENTTALHDLEIVIGKLDFDIALLTKTAPKEISTKLATEETKRQTEDIKAFLDLAAKAQTAEGLTGPESKDFRRLLGLIPQTHGVMFPESPEKESIAIAGLRAAATQAARMATKGADTWQDAIDDISDALKQVTDMSDGHLKLTIKLQGDVAEAKREIANQKSIIETNQGAFQGQH